MITPLMSMTRQSYPFIGCSPLLDARSSLGCYSDTQSIAATDARYRLCTHMANQGPRIGAISPLAAARQRVLVRLRCRHFLTEVAPTKRGNSNIYIKRSLIVLFEEVGPRQLSCGGPISSQPSKFPPQMRWCWVLMRRFCFAFSRDSRASRATLSCAGSSASPNLHAQLFRATRGSADYI